MRSSFLINKNLRKIVSSYSALHQSSVTLSTNRYSVHIRVVDQSRFDADPEPTFHYDADPDPIQVLNMLKISTYFLLTVSTAVPGRYTFVTFLVSVITGICRS